MLLLIIITLRAAILSRVGCPTSLLVPNWYVSILGLQQICIAEKRRLHIPAELAYAKVGDGKNVPPGADLVYDVEVVSWIIIIGTEQVLIFIYIDPLL